jgi:hypothetical protein
MPTFVRPKLAIIETGTGPPLGLVAAAAVVAAGAVFVRAHLSTVEFITAVVAGGAVAGVAVAAVASRLLYKRLCTGYLPSLGATQSAGQVAPVRSRQPVPDRPVAAILARQVPPVTTVLSAEVIREKVTR